MNEGLISYWMIAEKKMEQSNQLMQGRTLGIMLTRSKRAVLHHASAWTRIQGKLARTQVKCTWLLSSFVKDVPYAKMQDINSVSARKLKMGLDKRKLIGQNREVQATSFKSRRRELTVEVPTETEVDTFYKRLDRSKIKLVALSLIKPYSYHFVSERSSILTMPDLFDSDNLKILMHQ